MEPEGSLPHSQASAIIQILSVEKFQIREKCC